MEENKEEIKCLWWNVEDFDEWTDYEIFANYLDSYISFKNKRIGCLFQNWK
jgi:hypothetical protein